jgi:NMD protein affecting ribosome stability and mRNA decay
VYNGVEAILTSESAQNQGKDAGVAQTKEHRVSLGDQACPRCHKYFTVSYWSGETLVQARCLSCDLKWPRPDVV